MREEPDGRWSAYTRAAPHARASGSTRERCLAALRRAVDRAAARSGEDTPTSLLVETLPLLAGIAEAAEIMGWDKRRVVTYIDRGSFPEPLQSLASGRVWVRSDVEAYSRAWHERHARRRRRSR